MNNSLKLNKNLSPTNVWALAFGCIIGWGAFVMPGNKFLPNAGPLGTAIAIGLAALILIVLSFNYGYMINRFPSAGGEFIYTNKVFGKKNAFICSWFLGLSYLAIIPTNATALSLIGRNLFTNIFQFGFHYTVAGYEVYLGEILLACSALILFALLSIRGVKLTGMFQTILAFLLIGGVLIITATALLSTDFSLQNLTPAFNPNVNAVSGVLIVLAVAPWAFAGFDTVPQASEEFNFSVRKSRLLMIIAILIGACIYIVLNTIPCLILPNGYETWFDYINDLPQMTGLISLPVFNAAYTLLGKFGLIILVISVIGAILTCICGFYMATSRLFYSMSVEGVLPKVFSRLHFKFKTPYIAILFILIISLISPFFGQTALNWIVDMSALGAAVGYFYTSLASLKYARQENNHLIIFTGCFGVIVSVIFMVLLLVPIPVINCSLSKESYIALLIWTVIGIIFYRFKNRITNV